MKLLTSVGICFVEDAAYLGLDCYPIPVLTTLREKINIYIVQ